MLVRLSDAEIEQLVLEQKPLPPEYRKLIHTKPKRGHRERELDVKGIAGSDFRLVLRQSLINPIDFSIILIFRPPNTNQLFRLRRYNSKHEHTNKLEGRTFDGFHVHTATERYQDSGFREDAYANPTGDYGDYEGAIGCMLRDCAFQVPCDEGKLPSDEQTKLF